MNARKKLPLLILTGLLTVTSGAFARPGRSGVEIRVGFAPPALRHEVVVVRPGRGVVWVPGYWDWRGGRVGYSWVSGRWVRPPHPHARWERPRWRRHGREAFYISGHWRY